MDNGLRYYWGLGGGGTGAGAAATRTSSDALFSDLNHLLRKIWPASGNLEGVRTAPREGCMRAESP